MTQPKAQFGTFTLGSEESLTISLDDGITAVTAYNKGSVAGTVLGVLSVGGVDSVVQEIGESDTWSQIAYADNSCIDGLTFTAGTGGSLEVVVQK